MKTRIIRLKSRKKRIGIMAAALALCCFVGFFVTDGGQAIVTALKAGTPAHFWPLRHHGSEPADCLSLRSCSDTSRLRHYMCVTRFRWPL